jgi:acyl-ACP thioesterase
MDAEKSYTYSLETELSDLNEDRLLKPYAYQRLFALLVDRHLKNIKAGLDIALKNNLAWALVSLSLKILKPVEGSVELAANTWYSQRRGPFFRRDFVFSYGNGATAFQGSAFSVLLDFEKRTVYRRKETPFFSREPTEEITIEADPTVKTSLEFSRVDERRVYSSHIDILGHVNNCRYGEFAYDAFNADERRRLVDLKRMDIYFVSELRAGDTFSVLKAYDGSKVMVRGENSAKGGVAFDSVFDFG